MKLSQRHTQDFETYLDNIGLKEITKSKHLLYYKHFTEMFDSFVTQKTIDSFLQQKTSPNHRAMVSHLIELLKRDDDLIQEEKIEVGRFTILKRVGRKGKNLLRIITVEEFNKFVKECNLSSDFNTQRFRLMIQWQYYSGMRITELCMLKIENLGYSGRHKFLEDKRDKLNYQKIHIPKELGKGNKESFVYVKTDVYLAYFDLLKKWFSIDSNRAEKIRTNLKPIWGINKKKYSKQFKDQFFNILGWRLPFGKSTHILRHSICTHLLQQGKDLLWVRDYMRHISVKTTETYLHLVKDRISEELEKSSSIES